MELGVGLWAFAVAIAVLAGMIKGMVGFAMPMIMISGLATVLPPEMALAGLILSTLVSNVMQAVRQGLAAAFRSAQAHWRYIVIVWVMIGLSAQLVTRLSDQALFLILGVPVTALSLAQLMGLRLHVRDSLRRVTEVSVALVAGFLGGLTGVWGPPTTMYLTALGTEKTEQVRAQGVIYGTGAVVLLVAHTASGVLNAQSLPFSAALVLPAMAGMLIGFRIQDRIDQEGFRRATLIVLVVAGLNLIRRGLMG
ncbi:MAG: sulfite exporter TauE/SafE family protein [Pseudomonadota bacterium]